MKKILIVDDDLFSIKLIEFILRENLDLQILTAINGDIALKILEENKDISVILLDIVMPIMDGKEFLSLIRKESIYKDISIISITTDDSFRNELYTMGIDDFIRKPVKKETLLLKLKDRI